ncbi:FtsW/RodA/SpoVE family cell cycle protein [Dehalobacterium formicoaceticum]|uniref:FtsW/RodA/SpoVE family cell cycle protein n=1 Tax=Dehalobacterium formicoaceticum TaxID=51515 RepID=A0ABT1Y4J9_9FIRM|nr:FtsW/RodA/SpoVE family cell cycle protein [Dehalobacterium formicoaceticum]MCR6545483.1 FtsW/RodA/SpoVE family cell cycle protein [Dehalobacterium formicoaceticum]
MPLLKKYQSPVNIIALINVIAFGLLYLYQKPLNREILIAGGVMVFIIYLANIFVINLKFEDEILFMIVSMLSTLGIIMIFRLDPVLGGKQIIWFVLGNVVFFIASFIYRKINFWERLLYLYPVFSLILFLLTMFFGSEVKGATNWIFIGDFSFQPSEVMKLVFIFFIAAYYAHPDKLALNNLKVFRRKISVESKWVFMGLAFFQMGLLVLQRELGTILVLLLIYLTMVYIYEEDRKFFYLNGALLFFGGIIGASSLHYVQVRIAAWLNPWSDVAGKGYQIAQSLFAIGSGGFWGTGLGLGQPQYIPEVHTDFIFSAICEEMGIFGGVAVLLLYFILVYRGIKISLGLKNSFHQYIALGISLMFGFQTFIIIGGVIKLIPLTGITLPFVSYGGSSLITSFLALGILQSISSSKFMEEEELYERDEEKVPEAATAEKDN